MTPSQRIKKYLKERGVTQASVARRIGMSESKLSLSLSGKRGLTLNEFEKICRVLEVSPNTFVAAKEDLKEGHYYENVS